MKTVFALLIFVILVTGCTADKRIVDDRIINDSSIIVPPTPPPSQTNDSINTPPAYINTTNTTIRFPIVSINIANPSNKHFTVGSSIRIFANATFYQNSTGRVSFYQSNPCSSIITQRLATDQIMQCSNDTPVTLISTTTNPPYNAVFTPTLAGTYILSAVATDDNSRLNRSSNEINIVVYAEKTTLSGIQPTINFISPRNNQNFRVGSNIPISANVTFYNNAPGNVSFYYSDPCTPIKGSCRPTLISTGINPPYNAVFIPTLAGNYTLTIFAIDNSALSNNTQGSEINIVVE